jgi:hypothetical protein
MTPSGIEPQTFRFLTRHLDHCVTAICDSYPEKIDQFHDLAFFGLESSCKCRSLSIEKLLVPQLVVFDLADKQFPSMTEYFVTVQGT